MNPSNPSGAELTIDLTAKDARMLLSLLDAPPTPTAALIRAFARRKEILRASHCVALATPGSASTP